MRSLQLLFLDGTKLSGTLEGLNIGLKIRWLNWNNFPYDALPEELSFKVLTVLQIQFKEDRLMQFPSSITERPSSFWKLKNLQELDISTVELPAFSSQLKHLLSLNDCQYSLANGFRDDFEDFGSLESLEVVRASGLKLITELHDSFWKLKRLQKLDISDCDQITNLPPLIEHLKRLQELDICRCSNLVGLPQDFGCLERLEVLEASRLRLITKFPRSFGQLKRLRKLNI